MTSHERTMETAATAESIADVSNRLSQKTEKDHSNIKLSNLND